MGKSVKNQKRAVALVWTVVALTTIFGFLALSVDMGYILLTKTQLQVSADAAAMAAASQLTSAGGPDLEAILETAKDYAVKNEAGQIKPTLSYSDVILGKAVLNNNDQFDFCEGQEPYDAVKITVRMTQDSPNGALPLFFGRVLGVNQIDVAASAIATLVPRDIAVVIDLSNSMSYDSQLRHENWTDINIKQVWEDLGSPIFGNMTIFHGNAHEMPYYSSRSYSVRTIKNLLGLDSVPYPYSGGSWDDYIKYVQHNKRSSADGGKSIASDYEDRYGLRTWVNYLMDCRHLATETPELKDCRVQPVTAMKDAVEELCNYLIFMDSGDQVALIPYSNTAWVEEQLTQNYLQIIQGAQEQQAGSKGNSTNIANGIERARQELKSSRARPTAKKIMIVLTDGQATNGRSQSINAGHSAIKQGIQIYTISLGSNADQALMAELAALGKGIHFHVPTSDISQYEEELKRVFRTLGGKRPIRLIE